jgi:CBS domain containing-hemolysin-like protein
MLLLLVAGQVPVQPSISAFELNRRKKAGDSTIGLEELRHLLYQDIASLQKVLTAILMVLFVLLAVATLGWLWGAIAATLVALEYGALASMPFIRNSSTRLYGRNEPAILDFINRHRHIVRWLRFTTPVSQDTRIESKQELEHLITSSQNVLSEQEKQLIVGGLRFEEKLVSEIMTPKSVVDTIKKNEILGPLVLDDLHKTGHSRFPVIDEDIDHIVGVLYVKDVLTLDTNRRHTAKVESAMTKKVFYIRDDHNLSQALSAFLSTHHHLFVVINEFRETVGILTLEDTLEALLGRKIIDEFDAHDDMRAVAQRQASSSRSINRTPDSKDV